MKKVWEEFKERIDRAVLYEPAAYEQELRVEILRALRSWKNVLKNLRSKIDSGFVVIMVFLLRTN